METEEWRGIRRDANRGARWGLLWALIVVVVVVILSVVWWTLRVSTSDIKGQGDGVIEKNSSENWIAAQARFEDLYQDVVASDRKIQIAYDELQADPANPTLKTNYSSMKSICVNSVGQYDAEARKYLSAEWRAEDLPYQIDLTDPNTDCKENQE